MMLDITRIKDIPSLMKEAKWLEGKTLAQISKAIESNDADSRVTTKGNVGYVIENGFFGIKKNSEAKPDIEHLGVEIKTSPLKYNKKRDHLSFKEPLSLNIINYSAEDKCDDITDSSLYKKNKKILFVLYIHDKAKARSEYVVKYVLIWDMDDSVLKELRPDYFLIKKKILEGKAHEIHQKEHANLTLCPKHNGDFKDPNCRISKREQPHSQKMAEVRAFRLKNRYMNRIVSAILRKPLERGGWPI